MLGQLDTFIAFAVVILGVSLLITVLNQMAVALLGLRGKNLQWGLQTLLEEVDPDLKKHAEAISKKILEHPLISDSTWSHQRDGMMATLTRRWRWASAIRSTELIQILRELTKPVPGQKQTAWQEQLAKTVAALDDEKKDRLEKLAKTIAQLTPAVVEKMDKMAPSVGAELRRVSGDLEMWFDAVMHRVSQRFATRMRLMTVVFSVIIAFALHLDAYALLKDIDSNSQLKAALLTTVDGMIQRGDAILDKSVSDAYRSAAVRVRNETPELQKLAGFVPALSSASAGVEWINNTIQDPALRATVTARYAQLTQLELQDTMNRLRTEATAIRTALAGTGFKLVPDETHAFFFWRKEALLSAHFFGVLAAAALLSLGAPFWFQTLKTAASLRPVVANKEEQERAERS